MDAADDACGEWLTEDNEGRKRGCESISHSSRMWASTRRISQKQAHAFASLLSAAARVACDSASAAHDPAGRGPRRIERHASPTPTQAHTANDRGRARGRAGDTRLVVQGQTTAQYRRRRSPPREREGPEGVERLPGVTCEWWGKRPAARSAAGVVIEAMALGFRVVGVGDGRMPSMPSAVEGKLGRRQPDDGGGSSGGKDEAVQERRRPGGA